MITCCAGEPALELLIEEPRHLAECWSAKTAVVTKGGDKLSSFNSHFPKSLMRAVVENVHTNTKDIGCWDWFSGGKMGECWDVWTSECRTWTLFLTLWEVKMKNKLKKRLYVVEHLKVAKFKWCLEGFRHLPSRERLVLRQDRRNANRDKTVIQCLVQLGPNL